LPKYASRINPGQGYSSINTYSANKATSDRSRSRDRAAPAVITPSISAPTESHTSPYVVDKRSRAAEVVLEGIVNVKLPAVIVCEPNVWTDTALLLCVELYISIVSNAVLSVTFVYVIEAEGVQ
jgi:hypothetical protein